MTGKDLDKDLERRYNALPDDMKRLANEVAMVGLDARKYAFSQAKLVVAEVKARSVVPTSGCADAVACCDEITAALEALESR